MLNKIDWSTLPYNHDGWTRRFVSIFNPNGGKITFPQFISEMIIYNRSKIIKDYPIIKMGDGWSNALQKQVRALIQQAYVLCNYFPSLEKEPLVEIAFRNVFRKNGVLKIGQFRKVRTTKTGKSNITQDEKDIVLALLTEYTRLIEQRDIFSNAKKTMDIKKEKLSFDTTQAKSSNNNKLAKLLELERSINKAPLKTDTIIEK